MIFLGRREAQAQLERRGYRSWWDSIPVAFLGIGVGAAVLILVWGPTLTSARQVGFLARMFPLTGAVVVAVILGALSSKP